MASAPPDIAARRPARKPAARAAGPPQPLSLPSARGAAGAAAAPTPVPANAVSVFSAVALIGAALWPIRPRAGREACLLGFRLMLLWHVIDGADGDLARMKGTASATGELVDGVCDYARQHLHVFRLRLPARRLGWASGPGCSRSRAGASHIVPDQPCRDRSAAPICGGPMAFPGCSNAPPTGDDVFRKAIGSALFRLLGGRLSLARQADEPGRHRGRRGAGRRRPATRARTRRIRRLVAARLAQVAPPSEGARRQSRRRSSSASAWRSAARSGSSSPRSLC